MAKLQETSSAFLIIINILFYLFLSVYTPNFLVRSESCPFFFFFFFFFFKFFGRVFKSSVKSCAWASVFIILFLSPIIKLFSYCFFSRCIGFFFLLKIQALQRRRRQVLKFSLTSEVLIILLYFFTSYKVHFTLLFNQSKRVYLHIY